MLPRTRTRTLTLTLTLTLTHLATLTVTLTLTRCSLAARTLIAACAALAEALGGAYDNLAIAVVVIAGWQLTM